MGDVIRIEEGLIKRLFQDTPGIKITREEVLHLMDNQTLIASIYPERKYVEFSEGFRDFANHGPNLRLFLNYLDDECYKTNLK